MIILGLLIIFGVIGLVVAAVFKAQRAPAATQAFSARIAAPGEHLDSVQGDGNRLLLHLSGPKGDEIVVLDYAGRLLGRIAIDNRP